MKDTFESTRKLCEELKEYPEDDVLRAEAEGRKEVFLAWKENLYIQKNTIHGLNMLRAIEGEFSTYTSDWLNGIDRSIKLIDAAIKEIQEALQ